jgi:hypothetical protein
MTRSRLFSIVVLGGVVFALSGQAASGEPREDNACEFGSCAPKWDWDCIHPDIHITNKCDPQDPCCVICPDS